MASVGFRAWPSCINTCDLDQFTTQKPTGNSDWSWNDCIGFSAYENYYQRIFNYLKQGPPPPFAPDPTPSLTSIFQNLTLATEAILGIKLN